MTEELQYGSHTHSAAANIIEYPDERVHLEYINSSLGDALASAEAQVGRIDQNYRDMKRYMVEHRGEIDPHEMFQNEQGLKQIDATGAFAVEMRDKIVKLKDSPYFARIDFRPCNNQQVDTFYIGRFSFRYDGKLLVSDWRSPVASMFYDYEIGPASYHAPKGIIAGELTRKRQFKIQHGTMQYALESSATIQDTVLQQELSRTSDEKMKSIITTIQREQNSIIRNEEAHTLIIQGVAGSGKTSIALHRIAFLLYRFKNRLSARNVSIISPNKVFGDYISNVLPELGEEPIFEVSLVDIAQVQLERVIGFEGARDPLESHDTGWRERAQFKSTLDFVKLLDEFVKLVPNMAFEPTHYTHGRFTETADSINKRFCAYGRYPVKQRLHMIAEDLHERFEAENVRGEEVPKTRTILKALKQMLKVKDTLPLYKEFYRINGIPHLLVMPGKKVLEWDDVFPFLFVHAAFEGLQESGIIKHLVIDEMQDYTPIQYAVLNTLFKCQKTILGDFGQFLNPNHLHTREDLHALYEDAEYIELTKSYRSTCEIISFAERVGRRKNIDAIERHGKPPALITCSDSQDELAQLSDMIHTFQKSSFSSLGIIVKTAEDAKQLYDLLLTSHPVHLISPDSTRYENGISITSIQMSKGLEFDEVILPSVTRSRYSTEYDRNLLYIACTRAMHELSLMYTGEISPLIEFV